MDDPKAEWARKVTDELRGSRTRTWESVREKLRAEGHDPSNVVVVDFGPAGGGSDGGLLVTPDDGPVYEFSVDATGPTEAADWRDQREVETWQLVERQENSRIEKAIDLARQILAEG
jgi:hypothetical protein